MNRKSFFYRLGYVVLPLIISKFTPIMKGNGTIRKATVESNMTPLDGSIGNRNTSAGNRHLGLWDQGFFVGRVRTDYNDPSKGTANSPLTLDSCQYIPGEDELVVTAGPSWNTKECKTQPVVYPASNSFTTVSGWPQDRYWVLSVNNEPAYGAGVNSGPPNQSLPVLKPGNGVFGLEILEDVSNVESGKKIILSLDHYFAQKGAEGYIPFLGLGAEEGRGNGMPITILNSRNKSIPQKIAFELEMLKGENIGRKGSGGVFWFIATARWQGNNRMVFIALYHNGINHKRADGPFIHKHWNWNIKESFYYPGGDLVYMDAEDVQFPERTINRIQRENEKIDYVIDLQKIFALASVNSQGAAFDVPLPENEEVDVTGVHWAVEMTGVGARLQFCLQGMRLLQ